MVKTVNEAFNIFLRDYVNLDPSQTKSARNSRDWLLSQIRSFPGKDNKFPKLYSEKDISFGSFARKTKKRELDDIDLMIALSADGGYYDESINRIEIHITDASEKLLELCFPNTNILNSRRVVNKFSRSLNLVPQYEKADIKRNYEAATLNLISYPWTFDIVPCFFTQKDYLNNNYYLIPDGSLGHWKKTDPRIDRDRVINSTKIHGGNLLKLIRLMKYWNRRPTMPSISSYLLENTILDFYSSQYTEASTFVDLEIPKVLQYIQNAIYHPVNDPKGIQGNLNHLSYLEQDKISKRAYWDYKNSLEARSLEEKGEHKLSISKWREIFGSNFPQYS